MLANKAPKRKSVSERIRAHAQAPIDTHATLLLSIFIERNVVRKPTAWQNSCKAFTAYGPCGDGSSSSNMITTTNFAQTNTITMTVWIRRHNTHSPKHTTAPTVQSNAISCVRFYKADLESVSRLNVCVCALVPHTRTQSLSISFVAVSPNRCVCDCLDERAKWTVREQKINEPNEQTDEKKIK